MIRKTALIFALLLFTLGAAAQQTNEWIHFDQEYVGIPVAKDGLYKIPFNSLTAQGFIVTDPGKLQLFHRGTEQAIIVGTDFIEFIGKRNDGTLDKDLYNDQSHQPHSYHNLFSDTTTYFLTIGSNNGKRIETYQESKTGLPETEFIQREKMLLYTKNYSAGVDYNSTMLTVFDKGEGWMKHLVTQDAVLDYDTLKDIVSTFPTGGKPVLEMVMTGRGPMTHAVEIYGGASGRLMLSTTINGYASRHILQEIEWSDIDVSGELKLAMKVNAVEGMAARASINYAMISFSQEPDMLNATENFFSMAASSNSSLVDLQNALPSARLFDISNPADIKEITLYQPTNEAVVRASSFNRELFLSATTTVPEVKKINFTQVDASLYNYIIISHPLLRASAGGYADPVQAYADYRASAEGGSFSPLVVEIDQLYQQFNYGETSPMAIYNFMRYLSAQHLPDYLFLIGKGLDTDYDYFRNPDPPPLYRSLIPPAGYPASDMLYTAGLAGVENAPGVATGRLPAMHPEEVAHYLNKVKETEAKPFDDLRRKNILHLSGGIYSGEAQLFRGYLQEFAGIASSYYLGGNVDAIAKQSADIKLINISDEVNKGLGLVTFFGHSSTVTLDFDVGNVSDPVMGYDNKGKYPVLLVNGCEAGSFFRYARLFGEDWILTANKGAIGFIGHSALGFDKLLRGYSRLIYELGFADSVFIKSGLGDIQKETAKRFLENSLIQPATIAQAQQMMLLGDPAIRLFGADHPDFSVQDELVSISQLGESPVTVVSDSFAINFIVRNFGQAREKPLQVTVLRTLADNTVVTYDSSFAPVLYSDTLQFVIRGKTTNGSGINSFEIRIDDDNSIEELREDNNAAFIDYFIPENGTENLYPRRYAIVRQKEMSVSFQHTDLHSGERTFLLELDTVFTFDSPFKKSFEVSADVLARQEITLHSVDTLVYYWRSKIAEPLENESREWATSSFTYIDNGPEGWAQVDFHQFSENELTGLVADPSGKRFSFMETVTPLKILTYGSNSGQPASSVSVRIDSAEYHLTGQGFGCRLNTLNLIAFNRNSTLPYVGLQFQFFNNGGRACGREPFAINSFLYQEMVNGDMDLRRYVDNIEQGDSVVLFSIGDPHYELWPDSAMLKLEELGISSSQINALQSGEPVVIFGRKGLSPGSARIVTVENGDPLTSSLEVSETITGRFSSGKIHSSTVGPSLQWERIFYDSREVESVDQVKVTLFGVDSRGREHLLMDSVLSDSDLSGIDASVYPRLRLNFITTDDVNLTPAQLDQWLVTYEPLPEGLIFFNGDRTETVLNEGLVWKGNYGFTNVTEHTFTGPLTVKYKVTNKSSLRSTEQTITIDPPAHGDTTLFDIEVDTFKKIGMNDIEVYVNPQVEPEELYGNNIYLLTDHLQVNSESFNPVLDITVDGRYIQKDEYVSDNPMIRVRLWDDNKVLLKKDTVGVDVFFLAPCDDEPCPFTRVDFTDEGVTWTPATATSEFEIFFAPGELPDGRYTIRVSAKDQTGNPSGGEPFEISFLVKDEEEIILSEAFPNPVTGELNFNMTSSGVEPASYVSLRIVDLAGQLAGSWQVAASDLHLGHNPLHFELSGKLSPGLYIYHIIVEGRGTITQQSGKIFLAR